MAYCIDTNIFIYCADVTSPLHGTALSFLRAQIETNDTLYLPWPVVYSFLRIVTHPGIFENPLSPAEAVENIDQLTSRPNVEMLSSTEASWHIYQHIHQELKLRGNIIPDAQIVSILAANGIRTLYTNDRDFWKFTELQPVNPFS